MESDDIPPPDKQPPKKQWRGLRDRLADSQWGSRISSSYAAKFILDGADALGNNQLVFQTEPGGELALPSECGLPDFTAHRAMTSEKEPLTLWRKKAKEGFPTILYCHGAGGSLDGRATVFREMADRGFGVIAAPYPGFKGSRTGSGAIVNNLSEHGCYRTARAMQAAIDPRYQKDPDWQVEPKNTVFFGDSMGGAVALVATTQLEKPDNYNHRPAQNLGAVVCFAPFTSLGKRSAEQFPGFNPEWMSMKFDAEAAIAQVKAPVLLLHGKDDISTKPKNSEALKEAGGANVEYRPIEGVNHYMSGPKDYRANDPEQVSRVVDAMQNYLSRQHLCEPAPPREIRPTRSAEKAEGKLGLR